MKNRARRPAASLAPAPRPEVGWRQLARAMAAALRGYWRRAASYQRALYRIGGLLLLSAVVHLAVLLLSGGSWSGALSWRKPILFGESFGLTAISLAWILGFLPRRPVLGWLIAAPTGLAVLGEVVWVSLQQWRGVPSHFNFSTPFDQTAFVLGGGVLIGITGVGILAIFAWCLVSLQAPGCIAWAIRIGLLLLLAAQGLGGLLIQNGLGRVFDPETGEFQRAALDAAHVRGEAGELKLPHALSLHAIQVLPLLSFFLLFAPWSERRRTRTLLGGAAGYSGMVALATAQALSGRAPLDLDAGPRLVLVLSAAAIAGAYGFAFAGLRQAASD